MSARIVLLWLTLLSHYRQHKTQGVFLLAGLALGVAMFLATVLVSTAAKEAFEQAQQSISGEIVAEIKPANGRQYFSETVYKRLRLVGISHITPVVEGQVSTEKGFLQLQGMDLFPLLNQQGYSTAKGIQGGSTGHRFARFEQVLQEAFAEETDSPLFRFLFAPWVALVSESYATMYQLEDGQQIAMLDREFPKSGVLPELTVLPELIVVSDELAIGYALLCDIRCAQSVLGAENQLTSIRFSALNEQSIPTINAILGDQARLERADRSISNPAFTDAFLLNLKGIGLLAFLVGCFIAFNAAKFSVVQRQKMVRQLRLCGAGAREVMFAFFLELISWALLASLVGWALGWLISSALLPMIGLTLSQLFFHDNPLGLGSVYQGWGLALVISLSATIVATARPFWALSKEQPIGVAETLRIPPFLPISAVLFAAGVLLWLLPFPRSQELGLLIAACWFVSGALLVPVVLRNFYRTIRQQQWLQRFPVMHWAIAEGEQEQQRTSVAMMAYSIGLAASIAVMTMVISFEAVFTDYLDDALSESLYLRLNQDKADNVETYLQNHPSVAMNYRFFMQPTMIAGSQGLIRGLTNHPLRQQSISTETTPDNLWQDFHQRKGVLINQALALSQQLRPGDTIHLTINQQPITTEVLAVYYSYGSLAPALVMDQPWLLSVWPSLESYRIGVFLEENQDMEAFTGELVSRFALDSSQYIHPQQLKLLAHTIFQQTFYATRALATTILLIAAIGIFCSCYTSQLARARQNALISILGVDKQKALLAGLGQLGINLLLTSIIALPLGLLVALTSIQLVLRYSFGWYFPLLIDWGGVATIMVIGLAATVFGSLVPMILARKKTSIQELV